MSEKNYHFDTYHTATRFHIARELKRRGWEKSDTPQALFSEKNLSLDLEIAKQFEYKHLLADLLQNAKVDFFPLTYTVNDQNYEQVLSQITLRHHLINNVYQSRVKDLKWILKPATLNNGDEIKLFDSIDALKQHFKSSNRLGGDHVIQRYINNPALYNDRKFTYRVCSVFTNFSGIHLYKQGYANISAFPYQTDDGFENRKVHITNYVLDGVLSGIEQKLADQLPSFDSIYLDMVRIIKQCSLLLIAKNPSYLQSSAINVIEFFGFDFALDANGKLWLLEINQTPDCPIDEEHELMLSLWYPYWERIVDNFVLPAALNVTAKNREQYFTKVLDQSSCYSRWKNFLSQLKII